MKKVVITEIREGKVLIGAFQEGCDPYSKLIEPKLAHEVLSFEAAIESVLDVWQEAQAIWGKPADDSEGYSSPAPKSGAEILGLAPVKKSAQERTLDNIPGSSATKRLSKNPDKKIYLATGEGPFKDLQAAFDALGLTDRPKHNRYERLSKKMRQQIVLK